MTSTHAFGSSDRVSHDASPFYSRKIAAAVDASSARGEPQAPPADIVDQLFCASSESMHQIPDNCVALMVTSPPYNCGKDYDQAAGSWPSIRRCSLLTMPASCAGSEPKLPNRSR